MRACLGCSLHVDRELVGMLTLDALDEHAFDDVQDSTVGAFAALAAYDWPGNVRELEHLLLRASLKAAQRDADKVVVRPEDLGLPARLREPPIRRYPHYRRPGCARPCKPANAG